MKVFGYLLEGFAAFLQETQERKSRVRQFGEHVSQTRLLQIMPILVPPTILHEVKAVFHLPMIANQSLNIPRRDGVRIEAANKETGIVRLQRPVRTEDVTIHANKNFTTGNVQPLTNVLGVLDVAPDFSYFNIGPLFSTDSSSASSGSASAKHVFAASRMSG